MLLSPSNEVVALATNMYNSSGGAGNTTPAYPTTNKFGMDSVGGTQKSTNPFACSAAGFDRSNGDVFAGPQNHNSADIFSSPFSDTTSKPIFNGPNQSSVSSIFREPQSSSTGNIFGANQTSTSASIYEASQGGSSNTSSIFGGNSMSTNSTFQHSANIFGAGTGPKNNHIFGGPATFGNNQCSNVFGHSSTINSQPSTTSTNIFGQNCQTAPSFHSTGSPNGGDSFRSSADTAQMPQSLSITNALRPAQTSVSTEMANPTTDQSLFSSTPFNHSAVQIHKESFYSKTDDLSAKDLMAFTDNTFELYGIPVVPPPHELCT